MVKGRLKAIKIANDSRRIRVVLVGSVILHGLLQHWHSCFRDGTRVDAFLQRGNELFLRQDPILALVRVIEDPFHLKGKVTFSFRLGLLWKPDCDG